MGSGGGFAKANLAVLIVILMLAASFLFAFSSLPAKTEAYTLHTPIVILEDGDFTAANGVVAGSGAPADPYIISGWEIVLSSGTGILVSDTSSYFMIVDCRIHSVPSPTGPTNGITISSVYNGQIKNCRINNTDSGVTVQYSYDCSIHENQFDGITGWAVTIQNSNRVHVVKNHFATENGIMGATWRYSNVILNEFVSNEMCISVFNGNNLAVRHNLATGCGHPVFLSSSNDVQVLNNLYTDCMYGIEFEGVAYAEVRGNVIDGTSATGISISSGSSSITVSDNVVNGTELFGGVVVEDSMSIVLTRNFISNNTINGYTGGGIALVSGCSAISVYNNSFIQNSPVQAQDNAGIVNSWNMSYPVGGNYWSNYVGSDFFSGPGQDTPGSDGIGDTPFIIDTDSSDFYPLMAAVPASVWPVANFTFSPVLCDVTMDITFDASGSYHPQPPKGITTYRWDFDCDGKFDTSGSSNPVTTHLFPVPGTYNVILEVEDTSGLKDMTTRTVEVLEGGIIPEFSTVITPVLAVVAIIAVAFRRNGSSH